MRGSAGNDGRGLGAVGVSLLCVLTLAGCADAFVGMSLPSLPKLDDVNPFAEKPVPLPGKRVSVIQQEKVTSNLAAADRPIMLPPQQQNDSWSQPGGVANNAPGHLAFAGAGKSAWSADAGTGSSFYGRLTASPIVYDDKVYTLDAAGKVSAFGTSGGAPVWRASTTPPNEKDQEGFGGGLAADGGRIYAGTGFGYRGGVRRQDRQQALGEERRIAGAHLADGRCRARVRGHEGGAGLLPLGLGRHRALGLPRHGRARQPALQCQPRRRWRNRRRALSER